jgi:hypothetical protein
VKTTSKIPKHNFFGMFGFLFVSGVHNKGTSYQGKNVFFYKIAFLFTLFFQGEVNNFEILMLFTLTETFLLSCSNICYATLCIDWYMTMNKQQKSTLVQP